MDEYAIFNQTKELRVSDGEIAPILSGCESASQLLVLVCPQLGDFDSLEYAWWLKRESREIQKKGRVVRAIAIGNRESGLKFCDYTGFPSFNLFVTSKPQIHQQLGLYSGLSWKFPLLSTKQNAWLNLMLMCAGIGSSGTLSEVFRSYLGDRKAPQLIDDNEVVKTGVLPPIQGSFFKKAGGSGFQRPFELATLRLRNMVEVLSNWKTYVPDASYLTVRGGTFLFDETRNLLYKHRDAGILGFAADKSRPLSFLSSFKILDNTTF